MGFNAKWGTIAATVDDAFRIAGPDKGAAGRKRATGSRGCDLHTRAVLRGLSTLRLFLADGQQALSLMPDGHELRRRRGRAHVGTTAQTR
eukprot:gene3777-40013_t